ncbi:MAG: hypothetical protein AB1424_01140 [Thermodesulfobacteriota bacterium]
MTPKDPLTSLEQIELGIIGKAMQALNATNLKLKRKLLREQLAGPTGDTSLAKRTGNLARSIAEEPAKLEGGGTVIAAKLHAGMIYAKVHFGPRGSEVKIVPIKAKMLAIPLAAAKTGAGVARGGPTSGIWGPTKCFRSKAGNLIIWGYQTGKAAMGTRQKTVTGGQGNAVSLPYARKAMNTGQLVPLFVLKDSVVIKRRIDPKVDLIQWAKPVLLQELKKAGLLKVSG